jgi:hypothetical protein
MICQVTVTLSIVATVDFLVVDSPHDRRFLVKDDMPLTDVGLERFV